MEHRQAGHQAIPKGETTVVDGIGNLLENRTDTIEDALHGQVTPKGMMGHDTALDDSL